MSTSRPRRSRSLALSFTATALVGLVACSDSRPTVDPAYRASVETWRKQRVARLVAPEGWLSVVGLVWLQTGVNTVGSAPENEAVLPSPAPPLVGVIEVGSDGRARLRARADAGVTLNGAPVTDRILKTDHDGEPDVLALGTLRLYLIARGGQLAIRIKDTESPARRHFKGIDTFPIDPRYRVTGTYEPFAQPREVQVPSAQGPAQRMLAPGVIRFTLLGRACALQPLVSAPDDTDLFIVFRDATTGKETYGAGRFLDVDAPAPGSHTVVLDFNLAYNPPCAFTPYATCPIPPPENTLSLAVQAGERAPAGH